MVELYVSYWNGEFYVGVFENEDSALKFYETNKGKYRDYRGEKFGFPYATPIFVNLV